MYKPATECLKKENLFYGNQKGSNATVFLLHEMNSKVPLELQKIKDCHSTFSPGLVTPPQPESPKNRGSRCTQRPLAPDLPGCL